jgi:phosphoribosylaminoimidazole-succinocarboxamide synthase
MGLSERALESLELAPYVDWKKTSGKVREVFEINDSTLAIVATDRLSAFDRQVGLVPQRGQILNRLSQWWFGQTQDIVSNHMIEVPHPNVMIVKKYPRVDLEMVVRGYLTGSTSTSIWKRYEAGQRDFGGLTLNDGMMKNEPLPFPILDPTSKAVVGHDKNLTHREIVDSGVVTEEQYSELERISLALFERGQELSSKAGLILVDTKYEFGIDPATGKFVLIDEIHTPDSSRFWGKGTYEDRIVRGYEPAIYDKEFIRLWFTSIGYKGEGVSPVIPNEVIAELRSRYIYAYEALTGEKFEPKDTDNLVTDLLNYGN